MKLRKYIYGSLIFAATISSCSKMEEEPYAIINESSFYKTPSDAESAIIYAYSILPEVGYYGRGYFIVTELPTENLTQKGDAGASNFELDELRTTPTNSDLDNIWTYLYRGIARTNGIINYVPGIPAMAAESRDQIVGEAHFLRALHYFNLVRLFGEVPVRSEGIQTISQIPVAKSSIKDIYDLIIADLKSAETLIASQKISEGRANKVATQALLAKVYLHLASSKNSGSPGYDFVSNADDMYAQARTYGAKVVNEQSAFSFTNSITDVWDLRKYKVSTASTEHILDAAVDKSGDREGAFTKLPMMFLTSDREVTIPEDPSNPTSPTMNIGSGWGHFWTESNIYNDYAANDKRKTDLIVTKYKNSGIEYTLDINSSSRPFTRKFIDPTRVNNGDLMSSNSPIIRYTDILLTYAEAEGPTLAGYAAVNKVRERAGLGVLTPGLNVADFRRQVVNERAWELAFEGQRLFDLRRTNTMDAILVSKYHKTITSGAYFFPIPQREIDTNPLMKP